MAELSMIESVFSNWFYHLTKDGETSLCGSKSLLRKKLPIENWGIVSPHIHERYCKKCEFLARNEGLLNKGE